MTELERDDLPELRALLERGETYGECWLEREDQAMSALVHAPLGWLIAYWDDYASSAHSENPDYSGPPDALTDYVLSNGQRDEHPTRFALPLETVLRALEHFRDTGERAPFVMWVED